MPGCMNPAYWEPPEVGGLMQGQGEGLGCVHGAGN